MQLPDETIEYQYGRLLSGSAAEWTPLAELQAAHYLPEEKLDAIKNRMIDVRRQVMSERELVNPPARLQPLQPGFIDLPQKLLDGYRKKGDASELGHTIRLANRLRENVDRVVVLGRIACRRLARPTQPVICLCILKSSPTSCPSV